MLSNVWDEHERCCGERYFPFTYFIWHTGACKLPDNTVLYYNTIKSISPKNHYINQDFLEDNTLTDRMLLPSGGMILHFYFGKNK